MKTAQKFWLTVRIRNYRRNTETDGKLSRRRIYLRDCLILSNSLQGENHPARGDEIELSIYETIPAQEIIGSFDTLSVISLNLPPTVFAEFWTGSAATDGATRDITIQFEDAGDGFYTITQAELIEYMPEAVDLYPKAPPVRMHPVVAELRDIRRTLPRVILTLLYCAAGGVALAVVLGALWKWVNP